MSTQDVSRLDTYRSRRAIRLAQAHALYGGDPARAQLVPCLSDVLSCTGGDRGAVLWVDEYGPSSSHVYCLLDLTAREPRRDFDVERLRDAWSRGVPGLLDTAGQGTEPAGFSDSRSALTVALGSDGTRAWFLAVDSLTPRSRLSGPQSDELMFHAGQVASLVLHRDSVEKGARPVASEGLAGWAVLNDVDASETDDEASRRIGTRFLLARLVRTVVDADFAIQQETLTEQVRAVEREFDVVPPADRERVSWARVLEGVRRGDRQEVAAGVLELADQVLSHGHLDGAKELYHSAYQLGVGASLPAAATDGARYLGVVSRRLGDWEAVFHWYGVARELAVAYDDERRLGLVLDGMGVSLRIKGQYQEAADCHREVIEIAERLGDATLEAFGYQSLMSDARGLKNIEQAVGYGWKAFELHPSAMHRYRALTSLAWILVEAGDYDSAEHAYYIVIAGSQDLIDRLHSLDALAYLKALKGDTQGFRQALTRLDELDWRSADVHTVATLLYYRGRGFALLNCEAEARTWLEKAIAHCETHDVGGIGEDAVQTARDLAAGTLVREGAAGWAAGGEKLSPGLAPIRASLRTLRERSTASTG